MVRNSILDSFDGRDYAKQKVKQLAKYMDDLDKMYSDLGFGTFAKTLNSINHNLNTMSGPLHLSKSDLLSIEGFTRKLSTDKLFINRYFVNSGFTSKLHQFWNLYQTVITPPGDILKIITFELNERKPEKEKQVRVNVSIEKASEALLTSSNIIDSLLENPGGTNVITSVLSALESRVEAHENLMKRMLNEARRSVNLNYDIEELCSVRTKIQKEDGWTTDVRAIRDAYSHGHYVINKNNGDYEIDFHNTERGYNFRTKFTRRDFFLFYRDYDRLLAIQKVLLQAGLIYKLMEMQGQLDQLHKT